MYAFVILSSLSVGFYLFLLVMLFRDAKRHRRRYTVTHPTPGGSAALRLARSSSTVGAGFVDEVQLHPVTRIQWKPAQRTFHSDQSKPVVMAEPVNAVRQVKCG